MKTIELMEILEGKKHIAYDDSLSNRSVGIGFNLDADGAMDIWEDLGIGEDFDAVYSKDMGLSEVSIERLFNYMWERCELKASHRALELGLAYEAMPDYKRFILADIVYNTGSVSNWRKVFLNKNPKDVIYEARRNPKELMDSRVCKISQFFGITDGIEECKELGLEYAKYSI